MKRVCAWCGEGMDAPASPPNPLEPITHGICLPCSEKLLGESGETPIQVFLDSLDIPTFLAGGDMRVKRANSDILGLVGKEKAQVEDHLGGEVFECVNSFEPGGCGKTEKCSACTVRNTVTHTFDTGESQVQIPAILKVRQEGGPVEMKFHLTTEKVGDRVLVQVEPAE
jgi:hypothetical protein